MAILRKKGPEAGASRAESVSVIGAGMRVVGEITAEGSLRIEGEVDGSVRGERAVIVGARGVVRGDITAVDVVVVGEMAGSIEAKEGVELQKTCRVTGDLELRGQHLRIEEGACFSGNVRMSGEADRGGVVISLDERVTARQESLPAPPRLRAGAG